MAALPVLGGLLVVQLVLLEVIEKLFPKET